MIFSENPVVEWPANVIATVSDNVGAPLLLGNEVLNRAAAFTIDNERKVVRFMLRS